MQEMSEKRCTQWKVPENWKDMLVRVCQRTDQYKEKCGWIQIIHIFFLDSGYVSKKARYERRLACVF